MQLNYYQIFLVVFGYIAQKAGNTTLPAFITHKSLFAIIKTILVNTKNYTEKDE